MTRASLRHAMYHGDPLGLFGSSHRRWCSVKKGVLINITNFTGKHLCWSLFIKKILQHRCFPMKYVKFLRTPILKNICERLLLFDSPQNTITNSGGEFGLGETSVLNDCFLNVTVLFDQMQPYNLYVS